MHKKTEGLTVGQLGEINAELHAEVARLKEELSRYSMSPGWADQRQNESKFVRVALGFAADADDVSPKNLVDAITRLNEQVRALAAENELKSEQNKFLAVENDRLETIIYKNILPYRQQGFIPGGIDDLIAATNQHMDVIKREVGAKAIEGFVKSLEPAWNGTTKRALKYAASIRAGEVPNV